MPWRKISAIKKIGESRLTPGAFLLVRLIFKMKKTCISILLLLSVILAFGQMDNLQPAETRPFVLGQINSLPSKILGETRLLNIYLPEGYNAKDSATYPVIYLLDGSADEDFIHIVGLVQFNSFSWVHQLPSSIVVGIVNVDRRRDFTFPTKMAEEKKAFPTTGHSDQFISFLEKELQPYIQNKFKTNQAKTIIGESLGGLLATEILLKKPQLFTKYIIVSPSLWWDNGSLLNQDSEIFKESFHAQKDIYIAVGKEGLTPTKQPRVMEVDVNVLADKIKASKSKTMNVLFDYLPQEDHATIMHQAVFNAFKAFSKLKSDSRK